VVTSGASLGIHATLAALCRPGDRVLLPDPCFPLYRLAAETLRLRVSQYPLTGPGTGYRPDWAALAELAAGARLLLWNQPANPLGTVCAAEWLPHLFAIVDSVPDLVLLADEVYEDLVLDGTHAGVAAAAGAPVDRTVSVFSFSKSYGMAAWRIGYVHAPAAWADRIAQVHWGAGMSTSTVAQTAARAALRAPADYLGGRRDFLRANRDHAVAELRAAGLPCATPAAGFFAWPEVGPDARRFADRCADEAGVLVSPGDDFGPGGRGHVRLNYAVPRERLDAGLAALTGWLRPRDTAAAG
jgi:aspartate/methionine/tyrosine aminotransferase